MSFFKTIIIKTINLFRRPKVVNISAEISLTTPNNILKGKKVVITGGTKGIGKAMAKRFVNAGAEVVITGRDENEVKEVSNEISCYGLTLNLQEIESFEDKVNQAWDILNGIDCLVNNAGISLHEASFFDVTLETFDSQFITNFKGPFFLTQKVVEKLIMKGRKGHILFISSETGSTADVRPYGLSKAALNSFVKGLASLLVKDNIRVNAIAPGVVATAMTGHSSDENLYYPYNSIGRLYVPEEIAEIASFLLSDVSNCVSGQIIECNNARTINARWK